MNHALAGKLFHQEFQHAFQINRLSVYSPIEDEQYHMKYNYRTVTKKIAYLTN